MQYKITTLANGLRILEIPSQDAESVVVDFFVTVGSRHERPEENGISHFLEHFLFKGTKKFPSAGAITQLVDGLGADMNAATSKESTQYYIKAPSNQLGLILEILTDMLQSPLLDEGELEREKGVIVEEINMYQDSPISHIGDVLEKAMWPTDPLGWEITGSKECVTSFTREMFIDYMRRYYHPENIIIGVSGKYDEKFLQKYMHDHWNTTASGKKIKRMKSSDLQSAPRVVVEQKKTEQGHVALGFKGFDYNHPLNPVVSVMSAILGGGMSSRLFTEVREKRGLAYYVRCSPSHFVDTGMFAISAGVRKEKIAETVQVILAELTRLKTTRVGLDELNKAKQYLQGKTTLALEDNGARLDWYLDQVAFSRKIYQPQEWFEQLQKVTPQAIQKVACSLFVPGGLTVAVIADKLSATSLQKHLNF